MPGAVLTKPALPLQRRRRRRRPATATPDSGLRKMLWVVVCGFIGYGAITSPGRPWGFTLAAIILGVFALLPAWTWSKGQTKALPIFPLYAATYLVTHVLQFLLAEQPLREYPDQSILRAALTASAFLLVGTLAWNWWVKRPRRLPPSCLALEGERGGKVLLLTILLGALFTVADHAGWLRSLPGGVVTAARSIFRGPVGFATFVLAMRWGKGTLRPLQRTLFLLLFSAYCLADASSVFLVGVITQSLMLIAGLVLGRPRFPWAMIVVTLATIAAFHLGKAEMRAKYWAEGEQGNSLAPQQYPAFYAEWLKHSLTQLPFESGEAETQQSVFSRANTVSLLLEAQQKSPDEVPFLRGQTYAIIPSALAPRLLSAGKASPHYSTSLLNVWYGNQSWESAQSTSIGWGLLNEAFANFGYPGCLAAGAILASFFGLVAWWCKGLPPSSVGFLVGIYTLGYALQTEMTAAIFITAYLQGLVGLLLMAWAFAEHKQVSGGQIQAEDTRTQHDSRPLAYRPRCRPNQNAGA